jgi:hypothetical protein
MPIDLMGQAVEQRSRHLGVTEHAGPFSECEIGGTMMEARS